MWSRGERNGGVSPASEGFRVSKPLRSFPATVRRVLLEPVNFFRNMARADSLWNPLVFAVACALISLLLTYLALPLAPFARGGEGLSGLLAEISGRSPTSVAALILVVLLFAPLFVVLGLYVGAVIYQVLVRIFAGRDNAGFDATLRVYAYTSAVGLLSWVPVVGYAAGLYGFFLTFLGFREVHGTTTGRALAVILVPLVFWVLLLFGGSIIQVVRG